MDLDWIRSFLVILEEGSMNAAAERLGVAQSSLTRRVQALEQELGGPLVERTGRGVTATAAGQALARSMARVLREFDAGVQETRQLMRGRTEVFRIGYLLSAASVLVNPALAVVRRAHPEARFELHDLSPGEQIAALRAGELDFALLGQIGEDLSREFHVRTLARLGVVVAVSDEHPLAAADGCALADLATSVFIDVPDADIPGYRHIVTQLCRRAGFRPRFAAPVDSLSKGLSQIVADGSVCLGGAHFRSLVVPGVRMVPVRDAATDWDLTVAWPPGRTSAMVETMAHALEIFAADLAR